MIKTNSFYRIFTAVCISFTVFCAVRYALPKPKSIGLFLTIAPFVDLWIDTWIKRYSPQLLRRTKSVFLWIFYGSIIGFLMLIIGFAISPLPYWTPVLRVYGYGLILILLSLKFGMACSLALQVLMSKMKIFARISSAKTWFQSSIYVVILLFAIALYGSVYEAFALSVERIEINDKNVPKAFDDYKIVQFSDIHIGSQVSEHYIHKLVNLINAENPDLVLFTGDMTNFYTDEWTPFMKLFSQIRGKDGIFTVLGNHDYGGYVRWKTPEDSLKNVQKLRQDYQNMHWQLLDNQHVYIYRGQDSIALAGVENYSSQKHKQWENIADAKQALDGVLPTNFIILLSHNPQHFEEELPQKFPYVNLTLSGHSHGGQMALGTQKHAFSLAQFSMRYWRGFHQIEHSKFGKQYLNVNVGAGFNALPFRINMVPRVSVITLRGAGCLGARYEVLRP